MKVNVMLFAVARERVGASVVDVEVPSSATVHHVRAALVERYPALRDVVGHVRFAVNNEYAADSMAISPECEIAVIPPVSGG